MFSDTAVSVLFISIFMVWYWPSFVGHVTLIFLSFLISFMVSGMDSNTSGLLSVSGAPPLSVFSLTVS